MIPSPRRRFLRLPLYGLLLLAGLAGAVRADLVARYTFDDLENPGLDAAGGDDNATQEGGEIFSIGALAGSGALRLDGKTPGFTIATDTAVDGDFGADQNFTVSAWFLVDRTVGRQRIFSSGGGWGLGLDFDRGHQILMTAYGIVDNFFAVDEFVTGKWYHIAVTVSPADENGDRITSVYLNGALVGEAYNAYNPVTNPMLIGSAGNGFEGFNGALDELAYYDTAMTPEEVQTLYASQAVDMDGDSMLDSWELSYGLDPTNPADANQDLDNDGLTNLQEFNLGLLPNNPDFDNDGYLDGVEDNTGVYVSETRTGTDPKNPDTDGDGILDGAEMATGPDDPYATHPLEPDTDGDGLPDGYEVLIAKSDPTNAASPAYPDDALVAHYSFDYEAQPGLDIIRGDDNGTRVSGDRITTGTVSGGAYQMNGNIGFRITANDAADPDFSAVSDFSISAWFRVDEPNGTRERILVTNGWGLGVDFYQPVPRLIMTAYSIEDKLFPAPGFVTGKWFHVAVTVSPPNENGVVFTRMYLNGELVGEDDGEYNPSTGSIAIGNDLEGFRGAVDEISYYSTALSPERVRALYEAYSVDSDGDGMPDNWESAYGLNPLDPADANQDFDNDGLTNLQEYTLGLLPNNPDTDGDGYPDSVEDNTGVYVSETQTGTDPKNPDTDGDGIPDGAEMATGPDDPYATNPLNPDTDGDGIPDNYEITVLNTDPTDPNDPDRPRGLVAHYAFEDPENLGLDSALGDDSAAVDSSAYQGFGEEAKIGEGSLVVSGREALRPGAGSLLLDADFRATAEFSTALWFKLDNPYGRQRFLSSSPGWGFGIDFTESGASRVLLTAYGIKDSLFPVDLTPGEWYHVAFTISPVAGDDAPTVTMYLNGEVIGTDSFKFNPSTSFLVGSGGGDHEAFSGILDDIRYYNKTLTAAEVTELYAMGSGTTPPPAGELRITNAGLVNGLMSLTFTSTPGVTYTIQTSDTLAGWQNAGTVTATGDSTTWTETAAQPAGRRFYRVIAP